MKAYILIKIRTGEIKQVVRQLRKLNAVENADMTFGPYDAVAVVQSDDITKLGTTLAAEIQPIPGVLDTLTCLAVDI